MATSGVLLRAEDGSLYYVPADMLDQCRLDGGKLRAVESALMYDGTGDGPGVQALAIGPRVAGLVGEPVADQGPASDGPAPAAADGTADEEADEDDGVDPLERFKPRRRQQFASQVGSDGDPARGAG